jgi:hypothetical protein
VQADHLSCFVKDAGEHVAGGTLTVGSGHVDAGVGELGIAEPLQPGHRFAQIKAVGRGGASLPLKHGQPLDEPVAGFVKTGHELGSLEVVANGSDL